MSQQRVLIIDDDADAAAHAETLLRNAGFASVATSRKPKSLWSSLTRAQPELILLDLMLPMRDGIQVLESFAEANLDAAIILTADSPERIINAAENYARMTGLRVLGSLRKPIWQEDLKLLLDSLGEQAKKKPDIEEQEFFRLAAGGALVNHYQPIIDAKRARVHRLLSVPRLNHPTMGLMSPAGMWDTAEAYAAAAEIDTRLLQTAIVDSVKFAEGGQQLTVSCNVSAKYLADPKFADQFLNDCRQAGLLPSRFCIDVVESDLRQNIAPVLGTLTRLGMRGVQLSVDEYGIGAITGGILSRLPASELIIGHQLLAATLRDGDARSRVIDIVEYGERHELTVIAKDIATQEHLGLLLDLGVTHFQGPVFTQARSYEEMRYWMRNVEHHLSQLGIISRIRSGAPSKS